MSDDSELLYVSATFGGNTRNLYRFQMEDGAFDYFDEDGRSAKQFLLRNPLPNGKFRSGFGSRRHPILGYTQDAHRRRLGRPDRYRRSSPPATASSKRPAGPAATASRRSSATPTATRPPTITRAASPTASSPARASGRARSSAMSARPASRPAPHLHYELIVNNRKVDPMRVRLPVGKVLKGERARSLQARARPHRRTADRGRYRSAEGRERQGQRLSRAGRQFFRAACSAGALRPLRRNGCPGNGRGKQRQRRGDPGDRREGRVAGRQP